MKKTIPIETLRADPRFGAGAKTASATLDGWLTKNHHRGRLAALEVEIPIMPTNITEALELPEKHAPVFDLLQKAADAWAAMTPEERATVGHVRYHFHESGAVVCQRIEDPRKAPRRPLR